ncbi:MAG: glucosaminidase domain-containing protein [Bacteroidetes bacterium]|nr:glucosaminidase domain-containing protein [Bacteroidota bacterium]
MQKGRLFLFILFLTVSKLLAAQDPDAVQEYVETYKDLAIEEMVRTGVPAAIKLAQGIHETEAGRSDLVLKSNNHFGIKCKNTWTGASVRHDDDARGECFRKYDSPEDSYRDHSDFLKNSTRYSSLFSIDPTDYASWAWGLKKAGYATNPQYPQILIKLIEQYNLNDYTLIALGKLKESPQDMATGKSKATPHVYSTPAGTDEDDDAAVSKLKARVNDYPEGLFKINDTKVIFAKKGTSFLNIAEQYNIPLSRLFEFNDMKEKDIAEEDQLVFLQRKRRTGNNEFHIVQQGETLFDIAQSEAIRLENLMGLNMLNEGQQPAIGERLFLHSKAPSMPRLTLKTDYNLYDNRSAINNQ